MTSKYSPLKPEQIVGLPSLHVTVILGPQSCGKTRNQDLLMTHFKCQRVVDEDRAYEAGDCCHSKLLQLREKFKDGDMFTTTRDPSQAFNNASILFTLHHFSDLVETIDGLELEGCAPA